MILFPNDALDHLEVERDYRVELEAARNAGFLTAIFDFDGLRRGEAIERVLRRMPESPQPQTLIYRGWMLNAQDYTRLNAGLEALGWRLINNVQAYRFAHHAPENYALWREWMPQTAWIEREKFLLNEQIQFDPISEVLGDFGSAAVIVKDWVKSQKHRWNEACFIPDASDKEAVRRVVSRFLELQGEHLTGGWVFRRFEQLRGENDGQKYEWRSFWLDGQLLSLSPNPVGKAKPALQEIERVARRCPSQFFTLDFAQREKGSWMIIEMGDGGVSGLPSVQRASAWYREFKRLYDAADVRAAP